MLIDTASAATEPLPASPLRQMVRRMPRWRGVAVSEAFPAGVPGFAESPVAAIVETAFACGGCRDFNPRTGGRIGAR